MAEMILHGDGNYLYVEKWAMLEAEGWMRVPMSCWPPVTTLLPDENDLSFEFLSQIEPNPISRDCRKVQRTGESEASPVAVA